MDVSRTIDLRDLVEETEKAQVDKVIGTGVYELLKGAKRALDSAGVDRAFFDLNKECVRLY